MLSQEFKNESRQRLLDAQAKLQTELSGLHAHTEIGEDLDDSALEVEDDEVSQGVITKIKADLEKISKALDKIEAGTYGMDDDGNIISEDRLKVLPWADKAL